MKVYYKGLRFSWIWALAKFYSCSSRTRCSLQWTCVKQNRTKYIGPCHSFHGTRVRIFYLTKHPPPPSPTPLPSPLILPVIHKSVCAEKNPLSLTPNTALSKTNYLALDLLSVLPCYYGWCSLLHKLFSRYDPLWGRLYSFLNVSATTYLERWLTWHYVWVSQLVYE